MGTRLLRLDISGSLPPFANAAAKSGGRGVQPARGASTAVSRGVGPNSRKASGGLATARAEVPRVCMSSADCYAEALLPDAPAWSYLATELSSRRSQVRAASDAPDRLMQRRIAALGLLQVETIRLERKQRKEGTGGGFYKLEGIDTKLAGAANSSAPPQLDKPGWH